MKTLPVIAVVSCSFLFAACVSETTPLVSETTPLVSETTPLDSEPSTAWYEDTDGDLYGDPNSSFVGDQPDNTWVEDNTDCDDAVAAINPGATELNDDQIDSDCDHALSKAPFIVGNVGPAGGIVFQTDGTNGLEAAPSDQDDGTGAEWGCIDTDIAGAGSLTDGAANTAEILAVGCESGNPAAPGGNPVAANLVDAYSLNGYSDWFLPSRDELNTLYSQKAIVGGFASASYWSSSYDNVSTFPYFAWVQYFDGGSQSTNAKYVLFRVRAVRAF